MPSAKQWYVRGTVTCMEISFQTSITLQRPTSKTIHQRLTIGRIVGTENIDVINATIFKLSCILYVRTQIIIKLMNNLASYNKSLISQENPHFPIKQCIKQYNLINLVSVKQQ